MLRPQRHRVALQYLQVATNSLVRLSDFSPHNGSAFSGVRRIAGQLIDALNVRDSITIARPIASAHPLQRPVGRRHSLMRSGTTGRARCLIRKEERIADYFAHYYVDGSEVALQRRLQDLRAIAPLIVFSLVDPEHLAVTADQDRGRDGKAFEV